MREALGQGVACESSRMITGDGNCSRIPLRAPASTRIPVRDTKDPMPKPPALAATVVLHRRAPALEVFWVQRSDQLQFLGGFHAFPGGRADRNDAATKVEGAEGEAATLIAAAAREVFEETGVLLARGARRVPVEARDEARRKLLAGEGVFADFLGQHALVLDARDFVPAGRWQSPPFQPGG